MGPDDIEKVQYTACDLIDNMQELAAIIADLDEHNISPKELNIVRDAIQRWVCDTSEFTRSMITVLESYKIALTTQEQLKQNVAFAKKEIDRLALEVAAFQENPNG